MSERTRGYAHRVDIDADIDRVWQALIDPHWVTQWLAPQARVDARAGGSYWMRVDGGATREAHIDVFLPPRRLRLIYMPRAEVPGDDSVIVDDFLLDAGRAAKGVGGTVVRLLGSGVPESPTWDPWYVRLRAGWERALIRLKNAAELSPDERAENLRR